MQVSWAVITGNISPEAINSMNWIIGVAMWWIIMIRMVVFLALAVLMVISRWKVFKKAWLPGWAIFVPFYNIYCMLEVWGFSGRNVLWIFIPPVLGILMIINFFKIAKKFWKHWTFGLGMLLLKFIFIPILAFDDSKYLSTKSKTTFTTKTITTPAKKIIVTPSVAVATKKVVKKTITKKPIAKKVTKKTPKPAPKKIIKKK